MTSRHNSASNELILAFLVVVGGPLEKAPHSRLSQPDDD
jgi:hypothetical protein